VELLEDGRIAVPKLLSREEACERIGCSITTLERLIKGDKAHPAQLRAGKIGRRVYVPAVDVERYLANRLKPLHGVSLDDLGLGVAQVAS
jgi:excisionase family DNA binding protein